MNTLVPGWSLFLFAALFWFAQRGLRRHIRLWALLTLPATALHELAHCLVGMVLGARPNSWSLWPKRVGQSAWRLGYVGFSGLNAWNSGAVALAPLLWAVLGLAASRFAPSLPSHLSLASSMLLGAALLWTWIALAPGRSDWQMAARYWPSSLVFLSSLAGAVYWLKG